MKEERREREKANLDHEALDDAVEARAAKVEGLAGELTDALLARAQSQEVLHRFGRLVCVELQGGRALTRLTSLSFMYEQAWRPMYCAAGGDSPQ